MSDLTDLTTAEKDLLARLLTKTATNSGRFWLFMGVIFLCIGIFFRFGFAPGSTAKTGGLIAYAAMMIFFWGRGLWLIGRRRHTRQLLDGVLQPATGVVTDISSVAERGWRFRLLVHTPSFTEVEGIIHGYGRPSWSEGERVDLLFLLDGERFFPRDLDVYLDMGQLNSPERVVQRRRMRLLTGFMIGLAFSLLIIFGVVLGWI